MKVAKIERVIVNAEECNILEKAKNILDDISLCGTPDSDVATELAERLDNLIETLLVCEENENSAFVSFKDEEITDLVFEFDYAEEELETETE
jgi:hypothetical protein